MKSVMKIKKSRNRQVLVFLLCIVFLTGCGGKTAAEKMNEGDTNENAMLICAKTGVKKISEGSFSKEVEYSDCTLRISCLGDENDVLRLQSAAASFEEIYPGIKTEFVKMDYNALPAEKGMPVSQMKALDADIYQIEWSWLYEENADETMFYDLYKEHERISLGNIGQQYLNLCTVEEKLQAIPIELSGKIFCFNESLFEAVGMDVPETLAELLQAGETFRTRLGEEYYPLALTIEDRMELLVYYLQSVYGKDWIVDGVLQFYAEEVETGMAFLLELENAHVIPTLQYARSDESRGRDAGWKNGTYGGVFADSSDFMSVENMLPDGSRVVVAERFRDMGTGKGGYVEVADAYAVSESSTHKQESALFLDFLINDEIDKVEKIALDGSYLMNYDYAKMMKTDTLYEDIIVGLSYGDYNAREAAQLLLDSFDY